jgi:hypothetical protein
MDPDCETLMEGLRRLHGWDMSGPEWLKCDCRECHRKREDSDKTKLPFAIMNRPGLVQSRSGFRPVPGAKEF